MRAHPIWRAGEGKFERTDDGNRGGAEDAGGHAGDDGPGWPDAGEPVGAAEGPQGCHLRDAGGLYAGVPRQPHAERGAHGGGDPREGRGRGHGDHGQRCLRAEGLGRGERGGGGGDHASGRCRGRVDPGARDRVQRAGERALRTVEPLCRDRRGWRDHAGRYGQAGAVRCLDRRGDRGAAVISRGVMQGRAGRAGGCGAAPRSGAR